MMGKTILVPIDGSSNAVKAQDWATSMAHLADMGILVVNVQPGFQTIHAKSLFGREDIAEYQQQLFAKVIEGVQPALQQAGVAYVVNLLVGTPISCIVGKVVKPRGSHAPIGMTVMDSRGTNPFFSDLLGSVSDGTIHSTTCPVTIIPAT